jgi:hypothetical protein
MGQEPAHMSDATRVELACELIAKIMAQIDGVRKLV